MSTVDKEETMNNIDEREERDDKILHYYLRLLDVAKRTRAKGLRYPLSKAEAWQIAKNAVKD